MLLPADDIAAWVDAIVTAHSAWFARGKTPAEPDSVALARGDQFNIEDWGEKMAAAWNSMLGD
jgi:hypothetical protein